MIATLDGTGGCSGNSQDTRSWRHCRNSRQRDWIFDYRPHLSSLPGEDAGYLASDRVLDTLPVCYGHSARRLHRHRVRVRTSRRTLGVWGKRARAGNWLWLDNLGDNDTAVAT